LEWQGAKGDELAGPGDIEERLVAFLTSKLVGAADVRVHSLRRTSGGTVTARNKRH
jgi:hypothetical protein